MFYFHFWHAATMAFARTCGVYGRGLNYTRWRLFRPVDLQDTRSSCNRLATLWNFPLLHFYYTLLLLLTSYNIHTLAIWFGCLPVYTYTISGKSFGVCFFFLTFLINPFRLETNLPPIRQYNVTSRYTTDDYIKKKTWLLLSRARYVQGNY